MDTCVASFRQVPDFALFPAANAVNTRILLFVVSTFNERLVTAFIHNDKFLSLLCFIFIVLV